MNREDIIRMAREAGFDHIAEADYWHPLFERFAELVAAHEREECAKVADEYANGLERNYSEIIADAIRARSKA